MKCRGIGVVMYCCWKIISKQNICAFFLITSDASETLWNDSSFRVFFLTHFYMEYNSNEGSSRGVAWGLRPAVGQCHDIVTSLM
jgi:hypothetical protein